MILFILFLLNIIILKEWLKGRGGSRFLLPQGEVGVGIPLPTLKMDGAHGVGFPFPP